VLFPGCSSKRRTGISVSVRVRRHRSHWPESLDEIPFIEEDDNYHTDFRGDEGDQ
jgi:hypothetical protein